MTRAKRAAAMIFAICLMSLFSLSALGAPQYGAWVIELSGITLSVDGEEVQMKPSVVITVGMTDDLTDAWLTAEVVRNDKTLATVMAEESQGGPSRITYTGEDECARLSGKDSLHRLIMEGLGVSDIPDGLYDALDMLDAFLSMPKGVEYLFSHLGSIKKASGNSYDVSVPVGMGNARFTLKWYYRQRVKKPFDLSRMEEDPFDADFREDAREDIEEMLMEDNSMEDVLIAWTLMTE